MALRFEPLTVTAIVPETADAFTIRFAKPEGWNYLPGQYLTLRTWINGQQERRAYSLSSTPRDPDLAVTIKCISGGVVSNHLRQTLKAGDALEALPPLGKFVLKADPSHQKHYILLGAGSGITPLMSILRAILADEPQSRATLIYGNRNQASTIFLQQLTDLAGQHPDRLAVVHSFTQPEDPSCTVMGRLEGRHAFTLIKQAIESSELRKNFYLCGPNAMMEAVLDVLEMLNVGHDLVFREYYSAPAPDASDDTDSEAEDYELTTQQVKVWLEGKPYDLTVTPDSSILDACIAADLDPPYSCLDGVCCTCRAKVHSGVVSMDEREGLSDAEIEAGYVLLCQAHPLSADVEVEFG